MRYFPCFARCSALQNIALGADWKWVGTEGCLEAPSNSYIEGADGKWYDTDGNGYAPADVPSNKAMTYYASKDLLPKAFAVYSGDDGSLNFYKRSSVPSAGEQFEGKTVTAVYTGIEYTDGSQPWSNYKSSIKTATVVDDGIQPTSTVRWFYNFSNMTQCDMSKLDTSSLANASGVFAGCSSLAALAVLSGWDTSKVTTMSGMFAGCFRLSVNCSNWDVSKVARKDSFKTEAPGVILPLAWQTSSDEGGEDSAIAPLCEEQGNGDALSVSDENGNDEVASKTDGEASADSETEGSNTASATDETGAKEEETSGDIVQEEPAAA